MTRFADMLKDTACLVADGAMGSLLYARGLAVGTAPEAWLMQHPERIAEVHRDYIAAGADIILTNTFGANRCRLVATAIETDVGLLNRRGAEIALTAAKTVERPVLVAGAVGPLWARVSDQAATALFAEQMSALAAAGVDLLWIETLSDLVEMRAAATAAAHTGLPFVMTASFDETGRTLAGHTVATVARDLAGLPTPPAAIGCNCGVGLEATVAALAALRAAAPQAVLVAKGNAGLPVVADGRAIYKTTPDAMAAYARQCRAAGARIIGGCCGTTPAHIEAVRTAVRDEA